MPQLTAVPGPHGGEEQERQQLASLAEARALAKSTGEGQRRGLGNSVRQKQC